MIRVHIRNGFFWGAGKVFASKGWKQEWGIWGIGIDDKVIEQAQREGREIGVRVGKYPELYRITAERAIKYGFGNIQKGKALLVIPVGKFTSGKGSQGGRGK